jgi:hypothetical protein
MSMASKAVGRRSACLARSPMICRSARASSTPRPPILPATPRVRRPAPLRWAETIALLAALQIHLLGRLQPSGQ